MRYKVLWIDDEFKKQEDFIGEAEQEGIDIDAVESHEEGMIKLFENLDFYHAVILDAKVRKRKDDTVTGLAGLRASRDRLVEINKYGYLPYFIFTGQPDYAASDMFSESYGKFYIKALDNEKLFSDLKEAIEKKIEYQIQNKYENAFSVCTEKYIGDSAAKSLLYLLKSVETDVDDNTEEKLNSIRKIVEKLFAAFNRIKILPDEVWKGNGNINNSSKFLTGIHTSYFYNNGIMPPAISFLLRSILNVTQDGSHSEGDLNLKIDYFIKSQPTGFLFDSVVFQLLEILVWFKSYCNKNEDYEKNIGITSLKPAETSTFMEGIIKQDKTGNYHCEDVIITYRHFGESKYAVGDKIKILKSAPNTNEKTMHLYPKSAIVTEKI